MKLGAILVGLVVARCMQGETGEDAPHNVIVCLQGVRDSRANDAAKSASKLFADMGVTSQWRTHGCPAAPGVIFVTFSFETRASDHPGALAFAQPFDGTKIVVFFDRIQARVVDMYSRPAADLNFAIARVLTYVLAHEVAHILQRLSRHSSVGIMKERWSTADFYTMVYRSLAFTPDDTDRIQRGLKSLHSTQIGSPLASILIDPRNR